MQIQRAILLSFAASAACTPLVSKSVVLTENGVKRDIEGPPDWKDKREIPGPPDWKEKQESDGPPSWKGKRETQGPPSW
ncbi:hypothetical protein GGR58DRAFT_199874 [Xylaria digitata]|nr:hypothetical protein GGR58DRAFT_199874 [Xylaria digitata]